MKKVKNVFIKFLALTTILSGVLFSGLAVMPAGAASLETRSFNRLAALDSDGQKLVDWINSAINVVSALTGVAIAGSVIYAGIQYSTSGGNPNAAKEAKKRISNAVIAILAYVFIYGFLQWIVPGGIF